MNLIPSPEQHTFDLQELIEQCAAEQSVPADQIRVLSVTIYAQAYEGGRNIGEVTLEYAAPARALYGLYTDHAPVLFMN